MKNLNTHTSYQRLRDNRAELRLLGKEVTGLSLAETLVSYSEKSMTFIETLNSNITTNDFGIADEAHLRDEPLTLIFSIDKEDKIENTEYKIEKMRASGGIDGIVKEMRLETDGL